MNIASVQSKPRAAMAAIPVDVLQPTRATRAEFSGLNKRHSVGNPMISCARMPLRICSYSSSVVETKWNTNENDKTTHLALIRMVKTISLASLVAIISGFAGQHPGSGIFASLALAIPAVSAEAMATALKSAWAGLAAGCLHTLAGADHLAALTPLTIGQSHLRASMLGALWGFGHSTGQLMLGLLMVILKDRFHQLVPALSKWGGTTVGLTLLAIGALGVYESFFEGDHHHDHGAPQEEESSSSKGKKGFGLATFATGIIYGLQPDALFVIIPALALPTKLAATAYILMFVLGTVTAMGAYAGVIGATSQAIKRTNTRLTANLSGAASAMAIIIGFGVLLSGWGINTPLAIA